MRIAAEQNLTQQLEGAATSRPQAALFQAVPAPTGLPPTGLGTYSAGARCDRHVFLDGPLRIRTYRSYILDI
jgi:hypothetical protein